MASSRPKRVAQKRKQSAVSVDIVPDPGPSTSGICVGSVPDEESDSDLFGSGSDVWDGSDSSDEECDGVGSGPLFNAPFRKWQTVDSSTDPAMPRYEFKGSPGPSQHVRDTLGKDSTVLEFFKLFMSDSVMELIVRETNRYAQQVLSSTAIKPQSRLRAWEDVTVDELWCWMALVILQGVVGKPEQEMYWSKTAAVSTPFFGQYMSRNRFALLSRFLHFVDNETIVQEQGQHPCWKLHKVWPVWQAILKNFQQSYTPQRDISIDESLMLYKGRLGFRQYIKLKRARFGIKFFVMCESATGYIWNSIIYTGKGMPVSDKYSLKEFGFSGQVVLTLLDPLLDQGYCLTADNYYMSPVLCDKLLVHRTDSYGTVRQNRKDLPPDLMKQKLKPGEMVAFRRGKILAISWQDKKRVNLLSSVHNATFGEVSTRGKLVAKPKVVIDYNLTMGGVDRSDQCLTYYDCCRKTRIYYKKLFRHIVDQAVFNSHVLHRQMSGKPMRLLDYRVELVNEILLSHFKSELHLSGGRRSLSSDLARLKERHFPDTIPPTPCKACPTKRCVVCCSKVGPDGKKVRRETTFWCADCKVGLCPTSCFRTYHTERHY
jgi:hypothetical protein